MKCILVTMGIKSFSLQSFSLQLTSLVDFNMNHRSYNVKSCSGILYMMFYITKSNSFITKGVVITINSLGRAIFTTPKPVGRGTIIGILVDYEGSLSLCWSDLLVDNDDGLSILMILYPNHKFIHKTCL